MHLLSDSKLFLSNDVIITVYNVHVQMMRERERERECVYLCSELYFVIVERRGGFGWSVYCRSPTGRNSVANDTPLTCWNIL